MGAVGIGGIRERELLVRPRLVGALAGARVAVVEAGGGFGKTVLADQIREFLGIGTVLVRLAPRDADPDFLCATLQRSLRVSRLSDLASAIDGRDVLEHAIDALLGALRDAAEPVLLVLDDAHHVSDRVAGATVERLRLELPEPHRLAILARSLPAWVRGGPRAGEVWLGTSELAFNRQEVAELVWSWLESPLPDHAVAVVGDATAGWPVAVALAAELAARAGDPLGEIYDVAGRPSLIGGLLDALTVSLDEVERSGLIQLSHLPLLSSRVAEAATGIPDLLTTAVSAGLPLAHGATGWRRLLDPVAEHLRGAAPLEPETAVRAAHVYLEAGEDLAAISTLLAGGLPSAAASALANLSPDRLERLGLAQVAALVESFPAAAIRAQPRVLLQLSRLSELSYRTAGRGRALARCRELAQSAGDDRLLREVTAEQALDLVRDGAVEDARRSAESVLAGAGEDELSARARALDCLARLQSLWSYREDAADATEHMLRQAALVSIQAGHTAWAAGLFIRLAQDVFYANCRHLDALDAYDEALGLLAQRPRLRALALVFRAEPLRELGRDEEARSVVNEAREIGRIFRDERILGYAAWEEMLAAAQVGERAGCLAAAAETERHGGSWFEGFTGLEFLSEAADALDRVGAHDDARAYLERAQERAQATPDPDLQVAEALVTARSGDPGRGRALVDAAMAGGALPPQVGWRLRLLGAYADLRRGAASVQAEAAAAFDLCLRLGVPGVPMVVEPAVAAALLPVAAAGGSASAAELHATAQRTTIRVLGGFEVVRAGRAVPIPPGRPATALKVIAVSGGRLTADELVELLWPEAPPGVGRARLRTVLSRVRSHVGEVLVRQGEIVSLAPGVEIDAARFELDAVEAGRVVRRDRVRGAAIARAALALYRGPVLPDDRYEDWAAGPRERLRILQLELLDIAAAEAERNDQVDEAVRLLHEAVAVEPHDEVRYERLARLLAAQGRVGSARAVLAQARLALARVGVSPAFDADRVLAGASRR